MRNDPVSDDALFDREVVDEMIERKQRDVAGDVPKTARQDRSLC